MADLVFFKSPKLEQCRLVLYGLMESVSDGVIVFIRSLWWVLVVSVGARFSDDGIRIVWIYIGIGCGLGGACSLYGIIVLRERKKMKIIIIYSVFLILGEKISQTSESPSESEFSSTAS